MRFLHTSDWQIGMPARFLEPDAAARFREARLDAVRQLLRLAKSHGCDFVLVCGDVFHANLLDQNTILAAADAMSAGDVPLYLLPGNHDSLEPQNVLESALFRQNVPSHVHVLAGQPIRIGEIAEIVPAPWHSKRPVEDLVAKALRDLPPPSGTIRIVAGHGRVDTLAPEAANDPTCMRVADLQALIEHGAAHFVALGDRHSTTEMGKRIWYSGTPEATDFREVDSGNVLLVDVDAQSCKIERLPVGQWRFVERDQPWNLLGPQDVEDLSRWTESLPNKQVTVLRLGIAGALPMKDYRRVDDILRRCEAVFAGVERRESERLLVRVDEDDELTNRLSGFARETLLELRAIVAEGSDASSTASDAINLLYQFAGGEHL